MSKDAAYVGHLVAKLRLKDRLCSICMEIHDQGHCRTYAKGEPTRRKLKVAFPDLETSNAQSRCKFATCLGLRATLDMGGIRPKQARVGI